jgi:hypothetical protein
MVFLLFLAVIYEVVSLREEVKLLRISGQVAMPESAIKVVITTKTEN